MIKKLKIESIFLLILFLNLLVLSNFDLRIDNILKPVFQVQNLYLKDFFVKITEIGNSLWFFLISIIFFIIFYFLKNKFKLLSFKKTYLNFLFLFLSILITGLITQILKHLIGRPRPNYFFEKISSETNFFNFDSAYHSFPSGHTSTIFVVALFCALLTPRIKYIYFIFASLVSVSRIVVGAHYITDVLAGIVVAFIGFKICLLIFYKLKLKIFVTPIKKINSNLFFLSLIVFLMAITLLTVGYKIDIFVSELFYKGNKVFILQSYYPITIFARKIFLPFLILYILIFPFTSIFLPLKKIYFNYQILLKDIGFIWFAALLNIIFIINLILKNLWGRARPNDIIELGGVENFTPWFVYSNACNTNCSFVSGDASVGFFLIIFYFITKNIYYFWFSLFSGMFLGLIRILEGGHFLSDVLISGFLIFSISFFLFSFFVKKII